MLKVSNTKFVKTRKYFSDLENVIHDEDRRIVLFAERGLEALRLNTPVNSGQTADSWNYEIISSDGIVTINYYNDNLVDGWFQVAVYLELGHGTNGGGYVTGYPYIDESIEVAFNQLIEDVWRGVDKS